MVKKFIFIIAVLGFSQSALAGQLISAEKALKKIYKKATRFEESRLRLDGEQIRHIEDVADIQFAGSHSHDVILYHVFEKDVPAGYAFQDTVIGKWGPIHYLAGLDQNGVILEVIVLEYSEIRGKPVAKRRFLKQYRGKSTDDPLRLRRDIDGVTGATISSRSLTDGIRKLVHLLQMIKEGRIKER